MAARTVVCPECSEKLPYGRLSCPACGSLLAAVAGGPVRAVTPLAPPANGPAPQPPSPTEEPAAARPRRRWRAKQNGADAAEEPQVPVAAAAPGPARPPAPPVAGSRRVAMLAPSKVGAVTLAARLDVSPPPAPPTPPVLGDWVPSETPALGGPSPWRRDGVQRPRDEVIDEVGRPYGPSTAGGGNGVHATGGRLPAWAGGPRGSTGPLDWPAPSAPVAAAPVAAAPVAAAPVAAAPVAAASAASVGSTKGTPPPGAYLPPSGPFSARESGLPRGQLVQPGSVRVATASAPRLALPVAFPSVPADETDPQPRPGSASLLADLPFDAPKTLPGWLIAAGCAAAIAGFLLPWSKSIPFATGFGYLDTWGLATPSHLLVLLMTMVALTLAILPNRVPAWLRTGVVGLVLGGLLLGITWPYLLDGFGAMIGALAVTAAAMLLIVGGLLAVRAERHAEDESPV